MKTILLLLFAAAAFAADPTPSPTPTPSSTPIHQRLPHINASPTATPEHP